MILNFLIATFLLITTSSTNALFCIDTDEPIKISNDFTFAAVQKAINNLAVTNKSIKCLVEIGFDYYHQDIEIGFGEAASKSSYLNTNRKVRVSFSMVLADGKTIFNPAEIENIVGFACDYADECDRRFVFDHLEWLFNAKYDKLVSVIRSLLTADNDNTGKTM